MRYLLLVAVFLMPWNASAATLAHAQKLDNHVWVFDWNIRTSRVAAPTPYSNEVYDCNSPGKYPKAKNCARSEDEARKMARSDAESHEKVR